MASRVKIEKVKAKAFSLRLATTHVLKTSELVLEQAKDAVPVRKPNENGRLGGRLRASLGLKLTARTYNVDAKVGSRVRYAEVVHEGARPHVILPRKKRMLSFKWNKAPRWMVTQSGKYKGRVMLKKVNHPGMEGVEYLTTPLRNVATRRGFRFSRTFRSRR